MGNLACDHIKPCNIGNSEQHNRRDSEYVKHWKDNHGNYIRTDLTQNNSSWVSEQMAGRDLQTYYNDIGILVKEKTGRAMQTKDRERVDKKTGKKKIIRGSSPLRESSVIIKPETTIEDVQRYAEACRQRWGITAIQIHIHRDEGHFENITDSSTWKPNLHAHIIWDWMDHETGKSLKLNAEDMSKIQDYAAECLGMERGKSKAETGAEHLERNDFILANQQKKMAANVETLAEQEKQLSDQKQKIEDKQAESDALDKERKEKRQKLNEENGNKLLSAAAKISSGVANVLGFGDLHEANEEIERLTAVNKELVESVPKKIDELNRSFKTQVDAAAEKKAQPLKDKISELEGQNNLLVVKNTELENAKTVAEDKAQDIAKQYEQRIRWRDTAMEKLGEMLYRTNELIKKAVDVILKFLRSSFNVFDGGEAKTIKDAIDSMGKTKSERTAIGNWLVGVAEFFNHYAHKDERAERAYSEVEDIVKSNYDALIQKSEGLSR